MNLFRKIIEPIVLFFKLPPWKRLKNGTPVYVICVRGYVYKGHVIGKKLQDTPIGMLPKYLIQRLHEKNSTIPLAACPSEVKKRNITIDERGNVL